MMKVIFSFNLEFLRAKLGAWGTVRYRKTREEQISKMSEMQGYFREGGVTR